MRLRAIPHGSKLTAAMAAVMLAIITLTGPAISNATPNIVPAPAPTPAHHVFVITGAMLTPRQAHTATLLLNGMVLITGGMDKLGRTIASAELFNPATGRFSATGNMNVARVF